MPTTFISKNKDFDQQCNYQKVWKILLCHCEIILAGQFWILNGTKLMNKKNLWVYENVIMVNHTECTNCFQISNPGFEEKVKNGEHLFFKVLAVLSSLEVLKDKCG